MEFFTEFFIQLKDKGQQSINYEICPNSSHFFFSFFNEVTGSYCNSMSIQTITHGGGGTFGSGLGAAGDGMLMFI